MIRPCMLGVLLLGACSTSTNYGFAVALTMQFDDSIDDATLAQVNNINLHVPEEGYTDDIELGRAAHRTERVVYRPNLGATSLTFELTAEVASTQVAYGQRTVTLQPNVTTFAEIVLSAGTAPDGGIGDAGDEDSGPKPTLSFVTTPLIATAHQPLGVVIADFDGDGINDVATASSTGKVEVFLASSDHALPATPSSTSTAVVSPGALAVGDFGGDASPDLVVADLSNNTLIFLINDGHANFAAGSIVTPSTQAGPDSIAVGDFDRDGRPDVALGSSTTASIYVYLSISNPIYSNPLSYATTQPVSRLRTADFNGDGYYDLIYAEPAASLAGVRISANGNFGSQAERTFSLNAAEDVVTYPFIVGKEEAILIGAPAGDATDALLLNSDSGVLQIDSNVPFGSGLGEALRYARVVDFAGASMPSVIATNYGVSSGAFTPGYDAIEVGKTSTSAPFLLPSPAYVSGTAPDAFAVGDLDGDGLPDIAVVNRGSDTLAVARQVSGGKIYAAPVIRTYASEQRVGDFNGDGKPDLVESDGSGLIYLHANDGFGNFTAPNGIDGNAVAVAVGDLNEDGLPDLVFGTPDGKLGALVATSLGSFGMPVYSTALATDFVDTLVRDVDGDGHLDAVLLSDVASGNSTGKNVVFVHGSGSLSFGTVTPYEVNGAVAVLVTDLDEDGHLDIVALSGSPANITWLRGAAGATFAAQPITASPVENAVSFVACDANGDGHVDLVVGGDSLHVLLGDGHGGLIDGGTLLTAPGTVKVATGDADGDGVLEVFAANSDSLVRVFRVTNGALAPAGAFAAGAFLAGLLSADFNGDHLADLVSSGSKVALLLNDTK